MPEKSAFGMNAASRRSETGGLLFAAAATFAGSASSRNALAISVAVFPRAPR